MAGPTTVDPMRAGLRDELRAVRRGNGPYIERLARLPWLIDCLGQGSVERAVTRLEELRQQHGMNPEEPIGAFFWLADQGLLAHRPSLEARQVAYETQIGWNARTVLRRSDVGIEVLAGLARDLTETSRPVGMFWLFQGSTATVVLDFWMNRESFRSPEILVNDDVADTAFAVDDSSESEWGHRWHSRVILDELPISVNVEPYELSLRVRATWEMPIWPVWQVTGWTADPRFAVRLQTFRQRAAEAGLMRTGENIDTNPPA